MSRLLLFLFMGMLVATATQAQKKLPQQDSIQVVVFLSEKCPICQSITAELKKLDAEYHNKPVQFIGMFPRVNSNEESLAAFQKKYRMPFPLMIDEGGKKAAALKASITPEVFVINKKSKKVLYSGRIDNSFESLGKQRAVVTQHYLQQALEQILSNKKPDPARTKAVGCLIM